MWLLRSFPLIVLGVLCQIQPVVSFFNFLPICPQPCGFFSYHMSSGNDSDCQCRFLFFLFFGYSCNDCADDSGTGSNGVPNNPPSTPSNPSPSPPSNPSPSPPSSSSTNGQMTMWSTDPNVARGGSCEYAHAASIAQGNSWMQPYLSQSKYCAVDSALYQNGAGCGKCYEISYLGVGGTDPGRAGTERIQVVDSGSAKEFDCVLGAFETITGTNTGIFPITYTEIPCQSTPVTAVILDGNNAWYVKVLFAGGTTSVSAASITVGSNQWSMDRVSGATWKANLDGTTNQSVSFRIQYSSGATETLTGCFGGSWPVATSSQCQ